MPCDYRKYPADWKQIRARILERAGHKCERCGVPNKERGCRDDSGKWWSAVKQIAEIEETGDLPGGMHDLTHPLITIVLTVSHLNHDIADNRDENLAALCQRCHLRHDAKYHAANAKRTRDKKRGQQDMIALAGAEGAE